LTDRRVYPEASGARAFLFLVVCLASSAVWAASEETDCDSLLRHVRTTKTSPTVTILAESASVRIEAQEKFCTEPIEKWASRDAMELPAPPAPPRETRKGHTPEPPPPVRPSGAGKARFAPQKKERVPCEYKITDFWEMEQHQIKHITYWLTRVFTIDYNGDGATENIGFHLEAPDHKDIRLTYFGKGEEIEGRDVVSLRIDDESVIPEICFGQVTFARKAPETTTIKVYGLEESQRGSAGMNDEPAKAVDNPQGAPDAAASSSV